MKFTVGRKISLLILAAAGGLAVSTAEGWLTLGRVFDAADYANSSALPATQALAAADRALHNERIDLWNHIASRDAEAMASHEAAINQDRGEGRDALAGYSQYARDEQDKALLENDRAAAAAFEAVLDSALALSKQGRKAEASALLQANVDVAATTDGALSAHVYYAAELARQQAAEAQGIEGRARRNSLLIALATLAAVVAIGVAIVLTVTRPLRHAVDVLLEIDRGNLQAEVRVRGNDETAAMLGALESMRGNLLERTSREQEAAGRERAIAAENARIRTSLDKSSTPMLVVDAGGRVGYANESMRELLARRGGAAAGRQAIDGLPFAALEWIPAQVRDAALAATSPWSTEFEVGGAHLRLGATPVADAQGQRLGTAVQWLDRTDEVRAERELHSLVQAALDGDLTVRAREEGKTGFYAALARGMNALLGSTAQLVQRVTVAAEQVASGAGEIARGNSDLSQRTERQAASLEQTASSMEEMTSTVRQTADNAAQANQLATTAREQASRGGDVVAAAIAAMGEITGASRRIADIINVIDEIAFQTNLLALNAAVEAARAGEQGRGFAVVAGEVRALAGRSASAAREIKSLIGDSVGKVEQGSQLVDQSGRTLADIVQYVKKVSDIVAEIAAASAEQASGVEQVNKAVMSMDEATQQNAALVEQVSAAADNLRQQSEALREVLEAYRVDPTAAGPGGPARMAA